MQAPQTIFTPTLPMLLRHGSVTLSVCGLITAMLTGLGQGTWDVNLVYSLSIGILSWLSIEFGRFYWSRGSGMPWPAGYKGVVIVILGVILGFGIGSQIGAAYQSYKHPDLENATAPSLLFPMAITIFTSAAMSGGFYLVGKSRHMQMQAEQAQRQAAEAQLGLLQAQLEPHMLFNTLANLRVLISSDPARAEVMLDHLIDYLRATLGGSRTRMHSLRDEFSLLNDYLALMAIRMGPRLSYQLDLPAELADVQLPPLLLQPLVENSIRHGLEPQLQGGSIQVQARQTHTEQGEQIELTVRDDGCGLPAFAAAHPAPSTSGFGTAQLRERLNACYGDDVSFNLIAAPQGGTLARLTFPLKSL